MPAGWSALLWFAYKKVWFSHVGAYFKCLFFNPYHTEYFYVLHSSPIHILLTCSIPVVSMYFQSEWKTVWILVRWLPQKPAYLDLQCFLKRIILHSSGQGLNSLCRKSSCGKTSIKQFGSWIRSNIVWDLIWVQTVCKGYHQVTF